MEEKCKWQAYFSLNPPVTCSTVKSLPEVNIITEGDTPNVRATGLQITTPELTHEDARQYAIEIANRCADYLTFLKQFPVGASLHNITQLRPPGTPKTGYVDIAARVMIEKREDVDLTGERVSKIIGGSEAKLNRQLSHYRRAIETDDPINKIRELFQVIEDEYGKGHPFVQESKWARHIVSHPRLDDAEAVAQAVQKFGRPYVDPSKPQDLAKLTTEAENMRREAERILRSKIQTKKRR